MNLVVDDAVEIRLATKTEEETRRELGRSKIQPKVMLRLETNNSQDGYY